MTAHQKPSSASRLGPPANPNAAADVASVVERYGIPGFTYHTWSPGRRKRQRKRKTASALPHQVPSAFPGALAQSEWHREPVRRSAPAQGEGEVARNKKGPHNTPNPSKSEPVEPKREGNIIVPWSEPEDLVGATLPILEDLPDIRTQCEVLRRDIGHRPGTVATAKPAEEDIEALSSLAALKPVEGSKAETFPVPDRAPFSAPGRDSTEYRAQEEEDIPEEEDDSMVGEEAAASFELKASRALATLSGELVYPPLPGRRGSRRQSPRKKEDPVQRVCLPPEDRNTEWQVPQESPGEKEGGQASVPAQRSGFEWTFSDSAEERRQADAVPRRSPRARPPQDHDPGTAKQNENTDTSQGVAARLRHLLLKGIEDE